MGHIFVTRGDLSRLRADAIVYSTSTRQDRSGDLHDALLRVPSFAEASQKLPPFEDVGDAAWLALDAPNHAHGVIAVATRGEQRVRAAHVAKATESALDIAAKHLEGLKSKAYGGTKRHLVAMPSLGTGSGGPAEPAALLSAAQVKAIRNAQQRHPNLDVAVVTYTAAAHSRFLAARPASASTNTQAFRQAARLLAPAILDGACVLFAGAGLSAGAGLPGWRSLLQQLVARREELGSLKVASDHDYEQVAQVCSDLAELQGGVGPGDLIDELFGAPATFPRSPEASAPAAQAYAPTLAHYQLLQLPFRYVVTTNYDHLIEQALEGLGRPWNRVVDDAQVAGSGLPGGTTVVKLHGSAAAPSQPKARAIVLTRREYDRFASEHPAKVALLEGLLLNHHFFFVGYGLADRDFRALYGRVAGMLENTQREAFAVDFEAAGLPDGYEGTTTLPFAQGDLSDKVRAFWLFLDELSALASGAPETFLANHEPLDGNPFLNRVHQSLLALAEDFESRWNHAWTPEEARVLQQVLGLLQGLGWGPRLRVEGGEHTLRWARIWQHLADQVHSDPRLRRELLARAFASAERVEHAEELGAALAKLAEESTLPLE